MSSFDDFKGINPIRIPEQKEFDGKPFPLVLAPSEEAPTADLTFLETWLQSNHHQLDKLLLEHKAILFRNFNVQSHDDFHRVAESTGYNAMEYLGGAAVRTQLTSRVFTANESPASEKIPFHHELAQTPSPPTHLFFFCEVAPTVGGETPILISSKVCDALYTKHEQYMQHIESVGVKYVRTIPEYDDPTSAIGRGWRSTYLCEDRGR
jgi:alpha-ketoglutarate-dependent taurine dioxygenase